MQIHMSMTREAGNLLLWNFFETLLETQCTFQYLCVTVISNLEGEKGIGGQMWLVRKSSQLITWSDNIAVATSVLSFLTKTEFIGWVEGFHDK